METPAANRTATSMENFQYFKVKFAISEAASGAEVAMKLYEMREGVGDILNKRHRHLRENNITQSDIWILSNVQLSSITRTARRLLTSYSAVHDDVKIRFIQQSVITLTSLCVNRYQGDVRMLDEAPELRNSMSPPSRIETPMRMSMDHIPG